MSALLDRPATLGCALRRASRLLGLEAECLEVSAAWLAAGDGGARRAAVRDGLRALHALEQTDPPATLVAVPSPATLARPSGGRAGEPSPGSPLSDEAARSALQAFLRSLGELDVLAGVMFDGDDGVAALGGILTHYGMTAICIRRAGDDAAAPPGALVARALPMASLLGAAATARGTAVIITTDGQVDPTVAPRDLLEVSRAVARARLP
jgi:hypothetical protein